MKNKSTDFITAILIVVMIIGFYLVISNINQIEKDIKNITSTQNNVGAGAVVPGNKATTTESNGSEVNKESTSIPTAILFESKSSPLLEPQTDLNIAIENVEKFEDGQVNVDIKVFTNNADSYSATQPNNLFELVNLSGENQKPLKIQGAFDSIPPQSAVTGKVIFKVESGKDEIILQIQSNEGTKNYRFDFNKQNYQEAILG